MKKWPWKRIGWIAALGVAIYFTIGIIQAGHDLPPIPPSSQQISLKGGQVKGNRISTPSWSFDYDRAELSPDGTTGSVTGVHNGVLFKKGKPYMKISAQEVTLNTQTLDFTAIGKVHIERIDDTAKRAFDTDLVEWTNATKLLLLPHPSYVTTDGERLNIDVITVNFAKNTIHFGNMDGNVEVKK